MDDSHQNHRNTPGESDESARDAVGDTAARGSASSGSASSGSGLEDALVSAYLDGECTAAEQAHIEARMEASAELRQLVDELRGVRASFDLLSQNRLEADFAERVLRRAEREMLVGDGESARLASASATPAREMPQPAKVALPVDPGHRGAARPFLWTLAALAAAVLILVVNQEPQMRRDPIAQGPQAAIPVESLKSPAAAARNNARGLANQVAQQPAQSDADERTAGGRPAASSALAPPGDGERGRFADNFKHAQPVLEQDAPSGDVAARKKQTRAKDVLDGINVSDGKNVVDGDDALDDKAILKDAAGDTPPRPDSAAVLGAELTQPLRPEANRETFENARPVRARADTRGLSTDEMRLQIQPSSAADKEAPPSESSSAAVPTTPPPASAPAQNAVAKDGQNAPTGDPAAVANGADTQGVEAGFAFSAPRDSLRVVEVLVERDAWRRGAVNEVLAKNRIAVYESKSADNGAVRGPATAPASVPTKAIGEKLDVQNGGQLSKQQPATDGLELLVVSATPTQVKAALGDFGRQEGFQLVQVTDASAPAQLYRESLLGRQVGGGGRRFAVGQSPDNAAAPLDRLSSQTADGVRDAPASTAATTPQPKEDAAKKELPGAGAPTDLKTSEASPALQEDEVAGKSTVAKPNASRAARSAPIVAGEPSTEGADARSAKPAAGYGRSDTQPARGYFAESPERRRGGGGGFGGGRFGGGGLGGGGLRGGVRGGTAGGGIAGGGGARFAEDGTAGGYGGIVPSYADVPGTPLGFGQRVMLRQAPTAEQKSASATDYSLGLSPGSLTTQPESAQGESKKTESVQTESTQSGWLAPEQVLFVFRVVDAPLTGAAGEKSGAAATGTASNVRKSAAQKAQQNTSPVPAPAPTGGTAK